MKLKVCGMQRESNILKVMEAKPDLLGFIFFEPSPRVVRDLRPDFVKNLSSVSKVGVFVNESLESIMSHVEAYGLDFVQLHGDESPEFVKKLAESNIPIIKVFRVKDQLPQNLSAFSPFVNYFLFDTKTRKYGGSGQKFDWSILQHVDHPFFISGGVSPEDIHTIKKLNLKNLAGIDINSKIEIEPGLKDPKKVQIIKAAL